jgi:hypothetical protein
MYPAKTSKGEEVKFADRHASATIVLYTTEHHCLISTGTKKIRIQCVSSSTTYTVVSISEDIPFKTTAIHYDACVCDSKWWLGVVKKHSEEH